MKAAVTTKAGSPEVIEIQEVPQPEVKSGWVLIEVWFVSWRQMFIQRYIKLAEMKSFIKRLQTNQ